VFVTCISAGTWLDARARRSALRPSHYVLAADLHIHPYPGDGSLTVQQLRREAKRRGLDVLGVTGHNNMAGLWIDRLTGGGDDEVIVLPGQEITAPTFHLIAVGIPEVIDWRLSAAEAMARIHDLGGAAIAAHPVPFSWRPRDDDTLRMLDGVEVGHPLRVWSATGGRQLDEFFSRVRTVHASVSPIAATDFHMTAPLGFRRTYLIVTERSASAAIEAIRSGRTVAGDQNGPLLGHPAHVATVEAYLATGRGIDSPSSAEKAVALAALASLALLALPAGRPRRAVKYGIQTQAPARRQTLQS
jgi:hypothetical protein